MKTSSEKIGTAAVELIQMIKAKGSNPGVIYTVIDITEVYCPCGAQLNDKEQKAHRKTCLPYLVKGPISVWQPCDGRTLSVEEYKELYDVVKHYYGTAPPGKFKIPDLRGQSIQTAEKNS